jgi:hypothetical protein
MSAAGAVFARWLGLRPLERVAPEWATRTRDLYTVQGVYTRSILIGDAPPGLTPGWLSPFLLAAGDVTLSLHAIPLTPKEADRALRLRRTQYLTDIQQRLRWGRVDDPAEALALQSATLIEAQVKAGHARLFRTGVVLTLRAPTIPELAALERGVRDRLETLGATAWPLTFEHPEGFKESLPLFVRKLGREQLLDTTSLAYSFFFDANNVSMPAGPVWGYTTRGRRAVLYDPRNQALGVENPHVAILGPSGVGKSVAFAAILVDTLVGPPESRPEQVWLIDPKKDYERLCAYFGGVQVRWEVGEPRHAVNALQLYPERHLDQQLQDVLGLIALATTTPTAPMSPEDYAFWEWALRVTYERFGIRREDEASWMHTDNGTPRTPQDYPTLRDLYRTIGPEGECDRPTLAALLRPWAVGGFAGLFARPTTADLAAERLIVFDLEGLTHGDDALGRLRPMATYLIALFVFGQARASRKRRLLGTDEVATLLAQPATAHFFGNLLAMGRGYGLSVFHMSQQYLDYTQSAEGRRAMTSTATKLLLKQVGGENIAELVKDFQLTPRLRDFALGAKVGTPGRWGSEGLLVTPRGQETIEILPPPEVLELLRPPDGAAVVRQAAAVVEAVPGGDG